MARTLSSSSCRSLLRVVALAAATAGAAACGTTVDDAAGSDDAITSNDGRTLEMKLTGEVVARSNDTARKAIAAQLQYVQGILTTDVRGNGQTGMPGLTNVRETVEGDKKIITYEASLAVVWPKSSEAPATYDLVLPRDTTSLAAFNAKYDGRCGRNVYGQETFWHDFDPKAAGCTLEDADVVRTRATIAPHPQTTEGKYPEYDQVWNDDALDVVAVFGIISSNTPADEGARTREKLLAEVSASLQGAQRTEAPATPGVIHESTVTGTIRRDGRDRRVNVTAFLVQEASSAGQGFYGRYEAATAKADLVVYEGHSGLGANINALARNTGAQAGKYQLVYLFGCQTLAYLEPTMHEKRIALNGAERDPEGTKFLDVIANGLPAYGDDGRSTIGLYRALLDPSAPKTFNQLIDGISSLHLVTVFGEHDNTFRP
jgi:hypothetical protein